VRLNRQKILTLYDAHLRRDAFIPGMPNQQLPEVTRYVDRLGLQGLVLWHRFDTAEAPGIVEREIEHFSSSAAEFTWKVYTDDHPEQLPALLEQAGMQAGRLDTAMICDVSKAAGIACTSSAQIRKISESHGMRDLLVVWESVWPGSGGGWATILAEELVKSPERQQVLVAYDQEQPVATCFIILDPRRKFAYLGGSATIPSHRGRGIYRALVAERARIAQQNGTQFLAVEASPKSARILSRLGFDALTELRFFDRKRRGESPS
jgi:hypothetical protein